MESSGEGPGIWQCLFYSILTEGPGTEDGAPKPVQGLFCLLPALSAGAWGARESSELVRVRHGFLALGDQRKGPRFGRGAILSRSPQKESAICFLGSFELPA